MGFYPEIHGTQVFVNLEIQVLEIALIGYNLTHIKIFHCLPNLSVKPNEKTERPFLFQSTLKSELELAYTCVGAHLLHEFYEKNRNPLSPEKNRNSLSPEYVTPMPLLMYTFYQKRKAFYKEKEEGYSHSEYNEAVCKAQFIFSPQYNSVIRSSNDRQEMLYDLNKNVAPSELIELLNDGFKTRLDALLKRYINPDPKLDIYTYALNQLIRLLNPTFGLTHVIFQYVFRAVHDQRYPYSIHRLAQDATKAKDGTQIARLYVLLAYMSICIRSESTHPDIRRHYAISNDLLTENGYLTKAVTEGDAEGAYKCFDFIRDAYERYATGRLGKADQLQYLGLPRFSPSAEAYMAQFENADAIAETLKKSIAEALKKSLGRPSPEGAVEPAAEPPIEPSKKVFASLKQEVPFAAKLEEMEQERARKRAGLY